MGLDWAGKIGAPKSLWSSITRSFRGHAREVPSRFDSLRRYFEGASQIVEIWHPSPRSGITFYQWGMHPGDVCVMARWRSYELHKNSDSIVLSKYTPVFKLVGTIA